MRHWRFGSALLITTLAFASLIATATSAFASESSMEQEFVGKINAERSQHGLSTLSARSDLRAVARSHSDDMAEEGNIWHNDDLGDQVSGWTMLGENVGMGGSVDSLHQAFMNSPSHRANILEGDFNQISVGVTVDEDGTIFVTEVFAKRGGSSSQASEDDGSRSRPSSSSASSPAPRTVQPPAAKPKPKPVPKPNPRTVDVLVQMLGLDAPSLNPATGQALGA